MPPRITTREKMYLADALQFENLCVAKLNTYVNQVQNDSLRNTFQQLLNTNQQHITQLQELLGQSSATGQLQ